MNMSLFSSGDLRMHHKYTLGMFSNLIFAKIFIFVITEDNKFIDSI